MPAIDINSWMLSLLDQLQSSLQRQLVVLQGPQSWCDAQFETLRRQYASMPVLSNRERVDTAIAFNKADTCLGTESRLVALDLFDGFNPDVLCIAAGLVRAGGVLLLLSPVIDDWDMRTDRYAVWQDQKFSPAARFADYFFSALERDESIGILVTPGFDFASTSSMPELPVLQQTAVEQGMTVEQSQCLQQIEQWLAGRQTGIALIYAKRGRGKSSCLGLLVKRLVDWRVVVTANSKQNAATLLRVAVDAKFIAPDQLIRSCPPAELVIIDEAAMIPQSMLLQLSRLYPRLVMATTCDGYEGTGQGFMLRFLAALEVDGLIRIRLEKPVRWCPQDQLEAWLDHKLLLTDESSKPAAAVVDLPACELELLEDPGDPQFFPLLRQVYRLLNSAHYRTRPSDLRMLMENPDLVLIVARCDALVVGAALLNIEVGLDANLCEQIFMGRRRPRGQLLAQMLTAQAGIRKFAGYRGIRVQRIAVAEDYRRQGLGTRLLEDSLAYARAHAMDYVGASFALDPDTASFWRQAQFSLVHVSFAQGKSSGNQSIAVLQALNPEVTDEIGLLQQRIQQQLPTWMTQFLQTMDRRQVVALLRYAGFEAAISQFERGEIEAFAQGHKGFELCFASLQKYVMQMIAQSSAEPDGLLVEKAVQNRDWELLERESGAEGRRQLQQRLREQVDVLFKAC